MPRYEILSQESMAVIEEGWQSIVRDIGIEFQHEPALELFRAAGQKVEGDLVKLDPAWALEQVAKAPGEFPITARNPARSRRFGRETARADAGTGGRCGGRVCFTGRSGIGKQAAGQRSSTQSALYPIHSVATPSAIVRAANGNTTRVAATSASGGSSGVS